MPLVVSDIGAQNILATITSGFPFAANVTLHLFQNDHIPSQDDTLSSFVECSFPGYQAVNLSGWSPPSSFPHGARSQANPVTFQVQGANTQPIYGYYLTYQNQILYWAERDPGAPVVLSQPGQTYTVTPVFTMLSQYT